MSYGQRETTTLFLNGGLGNQLFQWAMGYARSRELETRLCLNVSNLPKNGLELNSFNLPEYSISRKFHGSYKIENKFLKRIWMLPTLRRNYYEKEFGYQSDVLKKKLTNFHGYFQSTEYFSNYFQEIIQFLKFPVNPSSRFLSYLDFFQHNNVLALHIRRGDYLGLDNYHGVLPTSYYSEALKELRAEDYVVVVFSNDIDFCRDHFPSSYIFIGPSELPSAAENLVLMSSARAIIGANSTLSFWSALIMDASPNLKVFPDPWFKTLSVDTTNLVPKEFRRIKVSF